MIPAESKRELVRVSNLTRRMTQEEKERFWKMLDPSKIIKGKRWIPGKEWNEMRPFMLVSFDQMMESLKILSAKTLVEELRRRGYNVKCSITKIEEI